MAIINGLTTLASLKAMLIISDTSQDTTLEYIISAQSARVLNYLGRNIQKTAYTNELYRPSFSGILALKQWPITALTSIYSEDTLLVDGADYQTTPDNLAAGLVYKNDCWLGPTSVRGLTGDPINPALSLSVTYTAGYLLPADVGYVAGGTTSLPLALQLAVDMACSEQYSLMKIQSFGGLKGLAEGGLSYTWGNTSDTRGASGFTFEVERMLNKFHRAVVL